MCYEQGLTGPRKTAIFEMKQGAKSDTSRMCSERTVTCQKQALSNANVKTKKMGDSGMKEYVLNATGRLYHARHQLPKREKMERAPIF